MSTNKNRKTRDRSFWIKAVCIFLAILMAGSYLIAALIQG